MGYEMKQYSRWVKCGACLYDNVKLFALLCGGLNDLELDGYDVSSIKRQSGCEYKIGMMVCCFDAEYISLLNVLCMYEMNFFPSTPTLSCILEIHRSLACKFHIVCVICNFHLNEMCCV